MHSAPAVSYPVARSALAGIAMLAVWLTGAAGMALWILHGGPAPVIALSAVGAALAIGAIVLRAWLRSPAGTLAWDGESWSWTTRVGSQSGKPEVALDAQRVLLLRWQGT